MYTSLDERAVSQYIDGVILRNEQDCSLSIGQFILMKLLSRYNHNK
jgi:hypothetical protein